MQEIIQAIEWRSVADAAAANQCRVTHLLPFSYREGTVVDVQYEPEAGLPPYVLTFEETDTTISVYEDEHLFVEWL